MCVQEVARVDEQRADDELRLRHQQFVTFDALLPMCQTCLSEVFKRQLGTLCIHALVYRTLQG